MAKVRPPAAAYDVRGPTALAGALRGVLGELGLPAEAFGTLSFAGDDPQFASPHRLAGAMAVAMLAAAAGSAAVGRSRGLPAQDLAVCVGEAARHLFPQHNWAPTLDGRPLAAAHDVHPALLLGIYRTRDGRSFVPSALSAGEAQRWARLLGAAPTPAALTAAIAAHDGDALEAMAARAGLSGCCARTPAAWAAHPHGRHLAQRPVVQLEVAGPPSNAKPASATSRRRWSRATRPLAGLRVLVLGRAFAGPLVGRTLAEQGAQVLHVGNVASPEPLGVYVEGFVGGRSAACDLKKAGARAQVRALAQQAHVVVDNMRPGVAARFALDADSLQAQRPGLVHVRIDAFGDDGPWGGRAGYDMTACAAAGLMLPAPDAPPRFVASLLLCDFVAGYLAAAGACAALVAKNNAYAAPNARVRVQLARVASFCLALGELDGEGPRACRIPRTERLVTPLGVLHRLAPAAHFSATPSAWPEPALVAQGSSAMAWSSCGPLRD